MRKKRTLSLLFALLSAGLFAQETAQTEISPRPYVKVSYLDSIKGSFVRNHEMACIDSLWMGELANDDLFEDMQNDLRNINPDVDVDYRALSTEVLKDRLAKLDAASPFNIEYSKGLENIIKSYLKNRPKSYERLMAISEYYFPMFEEHLAKYNVPLELKYLAIVESALNPRAKSPVGATGLWQFMYPTGKQYNLEVNSYVDERCDPLKATEAACQYLLSLYNIFGDWDLVLASYNAGPGNVTKAIRRSGNYKSYWNIRKNLPKETQAYNPAFLATMYIYEYSKEHGLKGQKAALTYFETDTVMVKRQMSFRQISELLDIPVKQLQFLNPIYKLDVIPFTGAKAHYLRLPKEKIGLFASNENAIYAYIDHESTRRERPYWVGRPDKDSTAIAAAPAKSKSKYQKKTNVSTKTYVVKSGDNLGAIADKYDVSLAELKKWNHIKGTNIRAGQKLKIQKITTVKERIVAEEEPETAIAANDTTKASKTATAKTADKSKTAIAAKGKEKQEQTEDAQAIAAADCDTPAEQKVNNAVASQPKRRDTTYDEARLYIVQKGDSLFSIARKHPGVTVDNLKDWNEIKGESIQPGMKLKVGDN
ncbi:LysM peptidoglycan-binding domain-containing protein [Flavobacterium sp. RHBU_3]|uniref:lytic transglycosylase domain-containing protein n=1 Tax=Flavobacterium sp. RHBU_3 TaxID=3391184 RepID=UPI003984CC34